MVDSISGAGAPPSNLNNNKPQNTRVENSEETRSSERVDSVNISPEAQKVLQESEARAEAVEARQRLEGDESATLGLDPAFDQRES